MGNFHLPITTSFKESDVVTQQCRHCNEVLSLLSFEYRNDSKKYRTECKPCRANREAAKRYNVSVGDIDKLKLLQNNSCAICGIHAEEIVHTAFKHNPLVIDHDHTTGHVRGLLCPNCNSGLGQFKENEASLINAITYLRKWKKI